MLVALASWIFHTTQTSVFECGSVHTVFIDVVCQLVQVLYLARTPSECLLKLSSS